MTASRNKPAPTKLEREHIARLQMLPCACCGAVGPSQVHEVDQSDWFGAMPLCQPCHVGPQGIHGDRALWRVQKLDERGALSRTVRMLVNRVSAWKPF